jgi:uncharacterized membrane protein
MPGTLPPSVALPQPGTPTRWARGLALAGHGLLLAGLPVVGGRTGLLLALPLLLPLPGLLRARPYTHAWAAMLVVFYVGGLLAEGWARPERAAAHFALAGLATLEVIALMLYVRFRAVEARRAQGG